MQGCPILDDRAKMLAYGFKLPRSATLKGFESIKSFIFSRISVHAAFYNEVRPVARPKRKVMTVSARWNTSSLDGLWVIQLQGTAVFSGIHEIMNFL